MNPLDVQLIHTESQKPRNVSGTFWANIYAALPHFSVCRKSRTFQFKYWGLGNLFLWYYSEKMGLYVIKCIVCIYK